jgi:hypothetical protein
MPYDGLATHEEFHRALRTVLEWSGLSNREVVRASGSGSEDRISRNTVANLVNGAILRPERRSVLLFLRGCGVRDTASVRRWLDAFDQLYPAAPTSGTGDTSPAGPAGSAAALVR